MRFPRLLKTSTLEPPKRNRARFPFDSLRGMARIRLISVILMLFLFSQKGHRPLALPLGELSPKATERGKAVCRCLWQIKACRFLNDKINLFALSVLAALGHLSQGERQGMPAERPAVQHCKNATKKRRRSRIRHIQAERHVRSAVCLLPTITVYRNCQSYFIVKSKRQNAGEGQKNTTKTTESAVSLYLAFLCNSDILESRMTVIRDNYRQNQ